MARADVQQAVDAAEETILEGALASGQVIAATEDSLDVHKIFIPNWQRLLSKLPS